VKEWGGEDEYGDFHADTDSPYNATGWESLFTSPGLLRFGKTDLVINGSLDQCTSILESSYGCGFRPQMKSSVLAGEQKFTIDRMEVFLVQQGGYDQEQQQQQYQEDYQQDYN
jgi:hypothetical protein